MNRITRLFCFSAVISATVFPVVAYPLDLVESYHFAVDNSADLAATRAASQAGELKHDVTFARLFPRIAFEVTSEERNKFMGDDAEMTSGNVRLTQPLWRDSLGAGLAEAKEQGELARLQYQKAQTALIRQVVDTYFNVLAAKDTLETTRSEINSIQTVRNHAISRREAGVGTETDVRIAEAHLALAKAAVIMAENDVENAMLTLEELIGHYPSDIKKLGPQTFDPLRNLKDSQHSVDLALQHNIDLAIQKAVVSIASHSIKLATSDADLIANLSVRVNSRLGGSGHSPDHVTTMVTISKSFSAAGLEGKQKKQATLTYQAELQKLKGLEARIQTLANTAYRSVFSLRDQINALELAVEANQSAFELTRSNYDVGVITTLEVLEAQQDLFEIRRDLFRARYEYYRNLIALEEISGTLALADLEELNALLQ